MEKVNETKKGKECLSCGRQTKKDVYVDRYYDVFLECQNCRFKQEYDGEPLSMIQSGEYN